MRRSLLTWLLLPALALASACETPLIAPPASQAPLGPYRAGEIVVQWREAAPTDIEAAHAQIGGRVVASAGSQRQRVAVPDGQELDFCRRYRALATVAHAEPNYVKRTQHLPGSMRVGRRVQLIPSDPFYGAESPLRGQGASWGLHTVNAARAWDTTAGDPGVTVAVIDTGVDMAHEDLAANIDRDNAINFVEPKREVDDDFGHGTHVAGIIAAVGNNGKGGAGLAFRTRVLPIRVLGVDGTGSIFDTVAALEHAVAAGAQVVNLSLGSPDKSAIEAEAIARAIAAGVVVVAAAGNEATAGNYLEYPASYPGVISVGAIGPDKLRAPFSNFNSAVTLSAPGVDIYSTVPTRFVASSGAGAPPYGFLSGTSMAAPFVSAAAALVLATHPNYTPAQVADRLAKTAHDLNAPNDVPGFDVYFGHGLLDAAAAVAP